MARARLLLTLVLALLAAPAWARPKPADYAGSDGGYLVYSVGDIALGMHFGFPFRRIALPDGSPANDWKGEIAPSLGGAIYLKVKNPDFEGRETGHVVIRRLPPGDYLIDNFSFGGQLAGTSFAWSSATPFAIPFTVLPGGATYIGSFMRAPSLGTALEPALGASGFFVIADRAGRDLPIAKARLPALPDVVSQVTNVDRFGNAALRSREPD